MRLRWLQECFLETGSLPVPDGSRIIPVINDLREKHADTLDLVVRSQVSERALWRARDSPPSSPLAAVL